MRSTHHTDEHRTKLPDETIEGRVVRLSVDNDGRFYGWLDAEHQYYADSLKDLREKLRRAVRTKKTRVAIEVSLLHNGRDRWNKSRTKTPIAEPAVITGVHASNHNLLIKRANGETEQGSSHEFLIASRLTEADAAEWVRLCEASHAATDAVEAFTEQHQIKRISEHVQAEMAKAAGVTPADITEADA